jgi:hypothetical protein|tara:strand:- start:48 stop:1349 length:1302 start_codon:yes stop_codon:yes gene_type:complete
MPSKIGFFKEDIQRNTGKPTPGTIIVIDGDASDANTMVFTVDSNLTNQATLNYEFVGLSATDVVEPITGLLPLDSAGNASITLNLVPTANLNSNTTFNMRLSSPHDFVLKNSEDYLIRKVGYIEATGGTSNTTIDPGNVIHTFNTSSVFNLTFIDTDPWTDQPIGPDIRVLGVGGGGAGGSLSSGSGFAGGGGGGGFFDVTRPSSNLSVTANYNVGVGVGGVRNDRYDYSQYAGGDTNIWFNGYPGTIQYQAQGGFNGNGGQASEAGNIVIDGTTSTPTGQPGTSTSLAAGGAASFTSNGGNGSGTSTFEDGVPGNGANGTTMYGFYIPSGSAAGTKRAGAGGGSTGFGKQFAVPSNNYSTSGSPGDYGGGRGTGQSSSGLDGIANSGSGGGGAAAPFGSSFSFYSPGYNGGSGKAIIAYTTTPLYRVFNPTS